MAKKSDVREEPVVVSEEVTAKPTDGIPGSEE